MQASGMDFKTPKLSPNTTVLGPSADHGVEVDCICSQYQRHTTTKAIGEELN
jgi:hypothetical protein